MPVVSVAYSGRSIYNSRSSSSGRKTFPADDVPPLELLEARVRMLHSDSDKRSREYIPLIMDVSP